MTRVKTRPFVGDLVLPGFAPYLVFPGVFSLPCFSQGFLLAFLPRISFNSNNFLFLLIQDLRQLKDNNIS
jgi:hypothetical protein